MSETPEFPPELVARCAATRPFETGSIHRAREKSQWTVCDKHGPVRKPCEGGIGLESRRGRRHFMGLGRQFRHNINSFGGFATDRKSSQQTKVVK